MYLLITLSTTQQTIVYNLPPFHLSPPPTQMPVESPSTQTSTVVDRSFLLDTASIRGQGIPHLHDASSSSRKHAILQAIKVLAMDRRDELSRGETEEDVG